VHDVFLDFGYRYGPERSQPDVQGDEAHLDARLLNPFQHPAGEVEAGRRRRHRPFTVTVYGLIPLVLGRQVMNIWRQRDAARLPQKSEDVDVVWKADDPLALVETFLERDRDIPRRNT